MKLRPEIRAKVLTYPEIPRTRGALIALTARFEQADTVRAPTAMGKREEKYQGRDDRPQKRSSDNSSGSRGRSRSFPKRPRLSDAEEQRRRENNLCFTCGKEGHRAAQCFAQQSESSSRMRAVGQQGPQQPKKLDPSTKAPADGARKRELVNLRGREGCGRVADAPRTTENLMSHLIAKEMGGEWEPNFTMAKGVGEQEIPLFGKSQLTLRIKDDEGVTREGQHPFVTTLLEEYNLML
jgi:hypothetical protein